MKNMRFIFLAVYFFVSGLFMVLSAQAIAIDSAQVQALGQTAWNIGTILNGNGNFIPAVPNSILHLIFVGVLGFFGGIINHKRRIKKQTQNSA